MTVKDFMTKTDYFTVYELMEDHVIQFINNYTTAHYRMINKIIMLGGDPTDLTLNDFYDLKIVSIEFNNNHCELWIEG